MATCVYYGDVLTMAVADARRRQRAQPPYLDGKRLWLERNVHERNLKRRIEQTERNRDMFAPYFGASTMETSYIETGSVYAVGLPLFIRACWTHTWRIGRCRCYRY
eukprot:3775949-Rhodomonas_salina.2